MSLIHQQPMHSLTVLALFGHISSLCTAWQCWRYLCNVRNKPDTMSMSQAWSERISMSWQLSMSWYACRSWWRHAFDHQWSWPGNFQFFCSVKSACCNWLCSTRCGQHVRSRTWEGASPHKLWHSH